MNLEYIKQDKKIVLTGLEEYVASIGGATTVLLFINDKEVTSISEGQEYFISSDGINKVTIVAYDGDALVEVKELGYILTIEYSKDKNRALMCSILDDRTHYKLSEIWIKRNKIIREIEYSFYSGNLKKTDILLKELRTC